MSLVVRPYQTVDFDAVYALWQQTLGANWSLSAAFFRRMISGYARYQPGDHSIAEVEGQGVGFVSIKIDAAGKDAGIHLLLVHPAKQRQGIGTKLHDTAMTQLRQKGAEHIHLAHDGGEPFFPGVPLNSPGAVDFFKALGWQFPENCYDLTRDLIDYQTPQGVLERAARQNIVIRPTANAEEAAAGVAFEQRMFPFWAEFFELNANARNYDNILAVWDGNTVIGSLLMNKADIAGLNPDGLWHQILGDNMGGIGAVGIDEARQGSGFGLAMVATASEILQKRGVRQCLIGWTDLLEFYGKLGYTPWREYAMTED